MPIASVAFPAKRLQRTVDAELRETFERVAARGAFRLGVPLDREALRMPAQVTPTIEIPKEAVRAVAAPAPTPTAPAPVAVPVTVTATPTPAPAPAPVRIARRAVSLGGMEDPMNYTDWQLGQLAIDPTLLRRAVQRTAVMPAPTFAPQPAPSGFVGGYPVVREEEKADWTTYAMIGAAILVVGGGVYYAKKKKMF